MESGDLTRRGGICSLWRSAHGAPARLCCAQAMTVFVPQLRRLLSHSNLLRLDVRPVGRDGLGRTGWPRRHGRSPFEVHAYMDKLFALPKANHIAAATTSRMTG